MQYFWIPSQPYFETFLVASVKSFFQDELGNDSKAEGTFSVYDCDGHKVNQVRIEFTEPSNVIPLEPLLGDCKLESGIRHALLIVEELSQNVILKCRSYWALGAHTTNKLTVLRNGASGFFPFSVEETVSNFLVICNTNDSSIVAKYRLFLADTNKEELCEIPPWASRIIYLDSSIFELTTSGGKKVLKKTYQAYVRIGSKSSLDLAVQLLTKEVGAKELPIFSTI